MTKVYYIENSNELTKALEKIEKFAKVTRELIEMNYSKVTIEALTVIGIAQAEIYLAELV